MSDRRVLFGSEPYAKHAPCVMWKGGSAAGLYCNGPGPMEMTEACMSQRNGDEQAVAATAVWADRLAG